jgi:hypothetical protein
MTKAFTTEARLTIAAVICTGLLLALALVITAKRPLDSTLIPWAIGIAFFFALISQLSRWLITKSSRRIFLVGNYPLALGLVRMSGFLAVLSLVALWLTALATSSPFRAISLTALIRGVILSATLGLVVAGLQNLLIVARHFRGTLATTTRPLQR